MQLQAGCRCRLPQAMHQTALTPLHVASCPGQSLRSSVLRTAMRSCCQCISENRPVGLARGRPPHLVGEALLRHFGIPAGTRLARVYASGLCRSSGALRQTWRIRPPDDAGKHVASAKARRASARWRRQLARLCHGAMVSRGMSYSCNPTATIGNRITNMKLGEQPIEALKRYRGWRAGHRWRKARLVSRCGTS
ncbi:MAG: hypothetical protein JWN13_6505 [Betaproteobacteria bacterium]|nr:hypothetical protein [Betaproteobacteria bacterium]